MQYRTLGNTGLELSIVAFGTSPLGGLFGEIDEDDGIRAVHAAFDGGINYVDTSPYYGLTRSEQVLGRALRDIDRDCYVISTKCGRYGDDADDFDFSAERVTSSIDESLQRLGLEHVDIYLAHDVEYGDLDRIAGETLPAMQQVKAAGKARFIGFSGYPRKVFTHLLSHDVDVALSHCRYTLLDTTLLSLLDVADTADVGLINAAPLSMGLLTNHGPPPWRQMDAPVPELCRRAAELCKSRGRDIAQLALQFAVAEPRIATTIIGMSSTQQVRDNLTAVNEPIDVDLLEDVLRLLEPVHNHGWISGRVENN